MNERIKLNINLPRGLFLGKNHLSKVIILDLETEEPDFFPF